MTQDLKSHIKELTETTAAKEAMQKELKIAHDIQMSMVPKIFPPFPHRPEFDIFAFLKPAREVGGDFYDFFFIDDDHLCFVIGDVSGKGVPASLFMSVTIALLRMIARGTNNPEVILGRANQEISRGNTTGMFITVFCGIFKCGFGFVTIKVFV